MNVGQKIKEDAAELRRKIDADVEAIPAEVHVPWASFTLGELDAASSALDWIFIQVAAYGVRTGTAHPDVMALIIAELHRGDAERARRVAEVIA